VGREGGGWRAVRGEGGREGVEGGGEARERWAGRFDILFFSFRFYF